VDEYRKGSEPPAIPEGPKSDLTKAIDAFAELYELLEEYSPLWYSQEVHARAQSALNLLRAVAGIEKDHPSQLRRPSMTMSAMPPRNESPD
jgi:hypothetical protein